MAKRIRAGEGIAVRTPLLPAAFDAWRADPEGFLAAQLARPEIREALFVASPALVDAFATSEPGTPSGARIRSSLARYLARMMGRATPFGLFSGVSAGTLGKQTRLELGPLGAYQRRTRLDNDYLFVLADELAKRPDVTRRMRYVRNSSLVETAGRYRCAVASVVGRERSYELLDIEPTPYLEATLERARRGETRAVLASALVGGEVEEADALAYIDELIDAQILLPMLGITVTGTEPIVDLLAQTRALELADVATTIEATGAALADLDAQGLGNAQQRYQDIAATLAQLPAPVEMARLFQVDMFKPAHATLSTKVVAEVAQVIEQLRTTSRHVDVFEEFRRAFRERWEDRAVPLAEVLDEESGIGFEVVRAPGAEGAPLLAGLPFPTTPQDARVAWGGAERHLLGLLANAIATNASTITLAPADITAMCVPRPAQLPDAFAVMLRVSRDLVAFDGTSGPSGARLLGRFCHGSPAIDAMVRAHLALEEAQRPDAVFAEIVHLNEGRIGNILCRPVLRAHELVYLGGSGAPVERQLTVDDLIIELRGERVVLLSRSLQREVIPRLTTAHNYRRRSLGVYRFLCALAEQDAGYVGFRWGPLAAAPHLPRVRLGNVVLSRETWNLTAADIAPITTAVRAAAKRVADRPAIVAAVATLREQRRLPRMVVVVDGDNELPIDLDNPLHAHVLAEELSGEPAARLVEMFPLPDDTAVTGPEGAFVNEVIVTYTTQREPRVRPAAAIHAPAVRAHPPGSPWLYCKLYCGVSTADRVLREVAPVIRDAIASGDARRWFFIRYQDPEPHLRLRFHGEPERLLGRVLPALERTLAPALAARSLHRIMLDTYVPEVARYGGERGIELVEDIFWHDSDAVLGIVELLEGKAGHIARWQLALRGIESTLCALGLSAAERAQVVTRGKESLGEELRADTRLWGALGDRFVADRAALEALFDREAERDAGHDLAPGFALLDARDAAIAPLAAKLVEHGVRVPDIAWSIVHMHANRLLHASQRVQELVLYDLLRRLHAAKVARERHP